MAIKSLCLKPTCSKSGNVNAEGGLNHWTTEISLSVTDLSHLESLMPLNKIAF